MMSESAGMDVIAERQDAAAATNSFISITSEVGSPSVAVKDVIDVAGIPTTAGASIETAPVPASDAPVIARLRAAGAAIVGKTNLYEWAYGVSSVNRTHGDVRNPNDLARSAGGSSSGSAAAVAAGLCDWAVGTDTAGSIRIPASLCGVVGYKPTHGLYPMEGILPLSPSQDVVGVLAPTVATTIDAASMMAGGVRLPSLGALGGRGEVALVVPAGWVRDLDPSTEDAWGRFARGLAEREFPERQQLFDDAVVLQSAEAYAVHSQALEASPDSFHPDVRARIRNGGTVTEDLRDDAAIRLAVRAEQIDMLLAPNELVVLPTTACVAPILSEPDPREPLTRFVRPFSGTGHPAISIPLTVPGLPVGLQLVARRNDDAWLLHASAQVELRISMMTSRA